MIFHSNKRKGGYATKTRGYTLIEILVVFFIMVSVMSFIIPDHYAYLENIELNSIAHEVALVFREAQVYGFGTLSIGTDTPYGVEIDLSDSTSRTKLKLFNDNDGNGRLTGQTLCGGGNECKQIYTLKKGFTISDVCIDASRTSSLITSSCSPGTLLCKSTNPAPPNLDKFTYLVVLYKRPNPDAHIEAYNAPANKKLNCEMQDRTEIVILSPSGKTKKINIGAFGRISVAE